MKIAIIGAGNVGRALAQTWSTKGHSIFIGARDESDASLIDFSKSIRAQVFSPAQAVEHADLALLSVPWPAATALAKALPLKDKVVMDCTNPLMPDLSGLTLGTTTSGAEALQEVAPNAKWVKAFNTVGFNIMKNPKLESRNVVMPYCGDDSKSKAIVKTLIEEIGFEAMDSGPLATARLLEPMALFWIKSALMFGVGRDFGFSVVRASARNAN